MSLTFVSAYLNIYGKAAPLNRTNDWRFEHFKKIAVTGIQLCVFVSDDVYDDFMEIAFLYPNIHVMPAVVWSELPIVQECEKRNGLKLPEIRHMEKDSLQYLQLQNSKTHFVQEAFRRNPWNSTHFAWIDFSIAHMFRDLPKSQDKLRSLSQQSWTTPIFAIPGCWSPWDEAKHPHHLNRIHWRFCGSFFIGDRTSMEKFAQEFHTQFCYYLDTYKTITWEVNIWAWMESRTSNEIWSPMWYKADHNDSIIGLPPLFHIGALNIDREFRIDCSNPVNYNPSSIGYVQDSSDRHWINIRFVNYSLTDQGSYTYLDNSRIIKTKNAVCELFFDENGDIVESENVKEMSETSIHLPISVGGHFAEGLEDIRLYNVQDRMRFIASTNNYSAKGRIQMVVGDYLPELGEYRGCTIIESPNLASKHEKNWTPFVRNDQEWFIYKWCPMELGKIDVQSNGKSQLVIQERIETSHIPWFSQFRGSTPLHACEKGWVCIVHFSEEGHPRKYYHCLVWLDKITMTPIQYSDPFYFKNRSVEFCIGMKVQDEATDQFVFWISQMDRDPVMVIGSPSHVHRIE